MNLTLDALDFGVDTYLLFMSGLDIDLMQIKVNSKMEDKNLGPNSI